MLKQNKWGLLFASLVTVLPSVIGAALWNVLPDKMVIHFGADGVADGTGGKVFAVFGIPLILLAVFWVCVWFTAKDNGWKNRKAMRLVIWIMPVLSCAVSGTIYALALGREPNMTLFMPLLFGALMAAIGNYMPKISQNRTLGIKIKWTLENEENWNATHRFAGKVWFFGGLLMVACVLLPETGIVPTVLILLLALVFAPLVYSFVYAHKHKNDDTYNVVPLPKSKATAASIVIVCVILIGAAVLMLTGNVKVQYGDTDFTIEATYTSDLTVKYDTVDTIEYRETFDKGQRIYGFGSARLSTGTFQNDEFGTYTLYAYTYGEGAVVLTADDDVLVIIGHDAAHTKSIYDEISTRMK